VGLVRFEQVELLLLLKEVTRLERSKRKVVSLDRSQLPNCRGSDWIELKREEWKAEEVEVVEMQLWPADPCLKTKW
jgi:hypothetical protein